MSMTGIIGAGIDGVKTMLVNSAAFRSWTGAGDVAAAAGFVTGVIGVPPASGPFAVITMNAGQWNASRETTGGGSGAFSLRRDLTLIFADEYEPVDDEGNISADSVTAFQNHVDAVIADLLNLANTGSYIYVSGLTLSRSPYLGEDDRRIYEEFTVSLGI